MVLFFYVLFVPVILLFLLLGIVKQDVLIEHLKQVFIIDPLPIRGYQKAAGLVLLSVLLYQILVYHNPKTKHQQPKAIKHMLSS
jgi:hypothetical protein